MKTILITRTTSGIGYSLSEVFASRGYHLILVARDYQKLEEQKKYLSKYNIPIDSIVCNLQQRDAANYIYEVTKKHHWHIDLLINNAGFNEAGLFLETDILQEHAMIDLHIHFVTDMMKLFLPAMKEAKYGRIMNIGSTGSYIACPKDAVYAATKAYILSMSKAINIELRGTGVRVTTLCPGSTKTAFAKKANIEKSLLFKFFVMSPTTVAKKGYTSMVKGKSISIPGLYNKLLVLSSKIIPYPIIGNITKRML